MNGVGILWNERTVSFGQFTSSLNSAIIQARLKPVGLPASQTIHLNRSVIPEGLIRQL